MKKKNPHAQALRSIKSEKRSETSRKNGLLGGRPKKVAKNKAGVINTPLVA
jgi:hypothetical protein